MFKFMEFHNLFHMVLYASILGEDHRECNKKPLLREKRLVSTPCKLIVGKAVFLLEPLNTSSGVDQFLCAGEEWVTCTTNFNIEVLDGGFRLEHIPASAGYLG